MRMGIGAARAKGFLHRGEQLNEGLDLSGRQAGHTGFLDGYERWTQHIDSRGTGGRELDEHTPAVGRMRLASDEPSVFERVQDASNGLPGHVQELLELPGASRPPELRQRIEDIEPHRRRVVHGKGWLEFIEQPGGRAENAERRGRGGWAAVVGWRVGLSRHPTVYPLCDIPEWDKLVQEYLPGARMDMGDGVV